MSKKNDIYNYEYSGEGLTTAEKRWGKQRFEDYQQIYPHLYKLSDLQLLEELVFLEALQERYKKRVRKLGKNKKDDEEEHVTKALQMQMKEGLDQIVSLKEKLRMFESKEKLDAYRDFQDIFEKFKVWRKNNQGSRKVTCPFCSKVFFLMIRTDKYDAKKFPMFQDKLLCNEEMHRWWKDGKISTEEYAKALGTSLDFPDWLDVHWFQKLPETK